MTDQNSGNGRIGRFIQRLATAIVDGNHATKGDFFAGDRVLQRLRKEQSDIQERIRLRLEQRLKDPEFAKAYEKTIAERDWSKYGT